MSTLIRFGRLLSLVLWIGGIAFFAFVVAPVAFGRLSSAHEAGLVVGGTLRALHLLGLTCGVLFLLLTAGYVRRPSSRRIGIVESGLVVLMLTVTAYSQFGILPAMEVDRTEAGGDVDAAPATNPARMHFEKLHKRSEMLEGTVLLSGIALLFMLASETERFRTIEL